MNATTVHVSVAVACRRGEEEPDGHGRMAESLYVDFKTGQILELVPKPGLRYVFEGTGTTRPLPDAASGPLLTIGDPEGAEVRQYPRRLAPVSWEARA